MGSSYTPTRIEIDTYEYIKTHNTIKLYYNNEKTYIYINLESEIYSDYKINCINVNTDVDDVFDIETLLK